MNNDLLDHVTAILEMIYLEMSFWPETRTLSWNMNDYKNTRYSHVV